MQVLGNDPPVHRKHGLDQPRDACRGFRMPDIGLHRADQQRAACVPTAPKDRPGRIDLDRVAHLSASPVCLQIVDIRWLDPGPLERRRDHTFLRRPVRNCQARARPVLVQRRAQDDPPDAVAVGLRIGEPLQH